MNTKVCSKCKKEKPVNMFYRRKDRKCNCSSWCKKCLRKKPRTENSKNYYKTDKYKEWRKKYRNNEKINNIQYVLSKKFRNRLHMAVKCNSINTSISLYLGCSMLKFKLHIEKQFRKGMTWNNYGYHVWHLDHIKPLSKFDLTKKKDLFDAFNYKNIRPLWKEDNMSKKDL